MTNSTKRRLAWRIGRRSSPNNAPPHLRGTPRYSRLCIHRRLDLLGDLPTPTFPIIIQDAHSLAGSGWRVLLGAG
jgi:hypothetical protein